MYLKPIGMRTNDFISLFNFNDRISIFFIESGGFFVVKGDHNKMIGIIAGCLYDNIGTIDDLEESHGRKEQKNGTSQSEIGGEVVRSKILRRRQ
jgi:hypothetical protein